MKRDPKHVLLLVTWPNCAHGCRDRTDEKAASTADRFPLFPAYRRTRAHFSNASDPVWNTLLSRKLVRIFRMGLGEGGLPTGTEGRHGGTARRDRQVLKERE